MVVGLWWAVGRGEVVRRRGGKGSGAVGLW